MEATLEACQAVKDHPLLARMKEIVARYKPYEREYEETDMLLAMVKRIASLIDPDNFPEDSEQKRKRRLIGYMGYIAKRKEQYPDLAEGFNHIVKTTRNFLPHLFAYLRCPQLPVTNNDLEVFHRNVKTKHRRRTGRKSSHDYIIRYGRFAVYQMGMDCRDRLKTLAYPKLKALKGQLESVRRRYSMMYRVRHKRPEFLTQLLDRWTAIVIPAPT